MTPKKSVTKMPKTLKSTAFASGLHSIELPPPKSGRRTSVFSALLKRGTIRTISEKKLPLQTLSNLLWAAWGVNRKKGPFGISGRTAASASNSQEIELYVALPEGMYLYEALSHRLLPVLAGDCRTLAIGRGQGNWGAQAPVRFIYVVDIEKFKYAGFQEPGLKDPEVQKSYYYVDTGLIAGNVYIFAASQGLATWFHNCDKPALAAKLKFRNGKRALFGQTVGYPTKG
jgi:Nitroreductase family